MAEVIADSYTVYVSDSDASLCVSDCSIMLGNGRKKVVVLQKGERVPESVPIRELDISRATGDIKRYTAMGLMHSEVHQQIFRTEVPAPVQSAQPILPSQMDKTPPQEPAATNKAVEPKIEEKKEEDRKTDKIIVAVSNKLEEMTRKDEKVIVSSADKEKPKIKEIIPQPKVPTELAPARKSLTEEEFVAQIKETEKTEPETIKTKKAPPVDTGMARPPLKDAGMARPPLKDAGMARPPLKDMGYKDFASKPYFSKTSIVANALEKDLPLLEEALQKETSKALKEKIKAKIKELK